MQADERDSDRAWRLVYADYDPATEGRRETLCAIGNGYFVTRAAAPDSTADATHYPGTYIAGLYDRLESMVGGHHSVDESLVNLPNWLAFTLSVAGGPWFRIDAVRLLEYCQTLDLRQGTLTRKLRFAESTAG